MLLDYPLLVLLVLPQYWALIPLQPFKLKLLVLT